MAAATAAGGDWRGAPANARAPFSSRRGGGRGGGSALAVMSSGASPGTLAYATGSAFDGRVKNQCNPCRAVKNLFKIKREIATKADTMLSLNFCKTKEFQSLLTGSA